MKKLALILAIITCFAFTACGKEKKEPKTVGEAVNQAKDVMGQLGQEAEKTKEEQKKQLEKNKVKIKDGKLDPIGSSNVELKSYSIIEDKLQGKVITIFFDYTNNSEHDKSFTGAVRPTLYQDGAQLSEAYFDMDYNTDLATSIKTGAKLSLSKTFKLRNESSDIEMTFSGQDDDYNSVEVNHTLKIKK